MVDEGEQKTDMISEANAAAERLEKANKEKADLLKREEALESRRILGGQTTAGVQQPQQKEETPQEYARRMMRGG